MNQEESFEDFQEDLLEEIDYLRLEPVTLTKIIVITITMFLPGIVMIILFAIYQGPWLAILLIVAAGLILMGIYLLFFEIGRLSDDKNIYIFDHEGFKTERQDGSQTLITWEDITEIEMKGRYRPLKKKRKCIVSTKGESTIILLNGFNEVTAKSKHPDTILREILKYYERMKKN